MNKSTAKEIVSKSVQKAVAYCGTQNGLAKRAGITQGAVGKYIRKESLPTGVTAKNLAKAVNYTIKKEEFAPHIFGDFDKDQVA